MLKITLHPEFKTPVFIKTDAIEGSLMARFKAFRLSEINAVAERAANAAGQAASQAEGAATGPDAPPTYGKALLREVLLGWEPFEFNGETVTHSLANLDLLCDLPGVEPALVNAFYKGHAEASAKN